MKKTLLCVALALAAAGAAAETCFASGERDDGMNKICYYDCPSGGAAITVRVTQLCPLSIKRGERNTPIDTALREHLASQPEPARR